MSLSAFSLIIGVYCYVAGFPMIFSDEEELLWRKTKLEDVRLLRLLGTVLIMIAVTTLRHHWAITLDGEGIIITVVWIVLLKGIVVAWWPMHVAKLLSKAEDYLYATTVKQVTTGCIIVALGAVFTYFGLVLV